MRALVRTYRPIMRNWQSPRAANFRFARQPPTIVTWAERHFYELPLIRPSGFVNSAASFDTNRRSAGCQGRFSNLVRPKRCLNWFDSY